MCIPPKRPCTCCSVWFWEKSNAAAYKHGNTGNVIKDVARVGIGKSNIRKPAGTLNIKRSGKAAAYKPGRKPLYHAKKKAVRGKVLVNRRRIIAAKKRKSSNNN